MRWSVASLVGLTVLTAASGCHSCQKVESVLRVREEDLREAREELERTLAQNFALQRDICTLRGDPPPTRDGVAMPVPTGPEREVGLSPVKSLVIGRQTGGRSEGNCPGDDCLQVQIEPRDPEGSAIKVAGNLLIQVVEITKEGVKQPLCSWELGPDQLRKSWRSGLLSSGYQFTLPWKVWPNTDKVRVVAQFRPNDGRLLEAEKDITIRLPPPEYRKVAPAVEAPPAPPAGKDREIAPPPRPVAPKEDADGPVIGKSAPAGAPNFSTIIWRPVQPPAAAEIMRPTPSSSEE